MRTRKDFTDYWGIETAAGRIGLVCCRRCGAAVIVGDEENDWATVHEEWHREMRRREPPDPVTGE